MVIRKTQLGDFEEVMRIYERAARYMAETGNPNQWAMGYPTRDMIFEDIQRGVSYVLDVDGAVEAVFAYIEGIDPTYGRIEYGTWKSNGRYATIHRIASAGRMRDVASKCFAWCEETARAHGCDSVRVDTHQDNRIMQHVVQKNGFAYCGVIYLANGAPRLAYEKVLRIMTQQSAPVQYATVPNGVNYRTYEVQQRQKGDGVALGIISMILGVVSVLLFCTCINFVTAIAAIVLGIIQIANNKDKSLAIVGMVTAAISILLALAFYVVIGVGTMESEGDSYYDEYYDEYYDDSFYDYFEEESGAEFL